MADRFYKKFDFWATVFAGVAVIISVISLYGQYSNDGKQEKLMKEQSKLEKNQRDFENENATYTKFLDRLNYEFSIKEGVSVDDWEISYDDKTYSIKAPNPILSINTGYISRTTLFVYHESEMITINAFPTSSFLREAKDMTKKSPENYSTSVKYGPVQIFGKGEFEDGVTGLFSYYFVLVEGTDGSKSLNLISYTFAYNNDNIEFVTGKVYSDAFLLDARGGTLKTAFEDFRNLREKLIEAKIL